MHKRWTTSSLCAPLIQHIAASRSGGLDSSTVVFCLDYNDSELRFGALLADTARTSGQPRLARLLFEGDLLSMRLFIQDICPRFS